MYKCEKCGKLCDSIYASGRFCSYKCARSFSTFAKRKLINKKISKKLKGHKGWGSFKSIPKDVLRAGNKKGGLTTARKFKETLEYDLEYLPWDEIIKKYSIKTIRKIILKQQGNRCARCGLKKWNGKIITLQLHHKDGNRKNNKRNNLECVCLNCHSLTENFGSKNKKYLKQMEKQNGREHNSLYQ